MADSVAMPTLPNAYQKQLAQWRKRRERAVAMHAAGKSFAEIAEKLQCSRQRVHQLVGKEKGKK